MRPSGRGGRPASSRCAYGGPYRARPVGDPKRRGTRPRSVHGNARGRGGSRRRFEAPWAFRRSSRPSSRPEAIAPPPAPLGPVFAEEPAPAEGRSPPGRPASSAGRLRPAARPPPGRALAARAPAGGRPDWRPLGRGEPETRAPGIVRCARPEPAPDDRAPPVRRLLLRGGMPRPLRPCAMRATVPAPSAPPDPPRRGAAKSS